MIKKPMLLGVIVVMAGVAIYMMQPNPTPTKTASPAGRSIVVSVIVPDLTENAIIGETIFNASCASCHGENAAGQDGVAPPLIHKIYEPSHHGDEAFQRAAALGVRSHHWRFGDMPPVAGLTRGDVVMILAYIRQIQAANNI